MKYEEVLEKAKTMASERRCPECESIMENVDGDVVVCHSCEFWVEMDMLEQVWEDHIISEEGIDSDEDEWETDDTENEDDGEAYSVYDAALAWLHSGCDEDYMFGYTEDELRDALRN